MTNYIGSSQDVHLTDKEYSAYLKDISSSFFCCLCQEKHKSLYNNKTQKYRKHSLCQIPIKTEGEE